MCIRDRCWVDELGEDDWCWEHQFKPKMGMRVMPALETAVEPMYFVAAAGTTATARSLQHWAPLSELRPHWLWRGSTDGWAVGTNPLVSGVTMREEEEEEDEEEEEEEVEAVATEPPVEKTEAATGAEETAWAR